MWCAWESSEKLFKNSRWPDPSPRASDLGGLGEAQELEFFRKTPQPVVIHCTAVRGGGIFASVFSGGMGAGDAFWPQEWNVQPCGLDAGCGELIIEKTCGKAGVRS